MVFKVFAAQFLTAKSAPCQKPRQRFQKVARGSASPRAPPRVTSPRCGGQEPRIDDLEFRVSYHKAIADLHKKVEDLEEPFKKGPIALPVLVTWVQEGRVQRDTWIYLELR